MQDPTIHLDCNLRRQFVPNRAVFIRAYLPYFRQLEYPFEVSFQFFKIRLMKSGYDFASSRP